MSNPKESYTLEEIPVKTLHPLDSVDLTNHTEELTSFVTNFNYLWICNGFELMWDKISQEKLDTTPQEKKEKVL